MFIEMDRIIENSQSSYINNSFKDNLKRIWERHGAILDEDMQSAINDILFEKPIMNKSFDLASDEHSSSVMHLATTLISSWEARNDGPNAMEAFNLLSSVAKKYFNLKLGDVKEETNFNSIAHEHLNNMMLSNRDIIRIIRPWVEWEGPDKRNVIIKAVVEKMDKQ